VNPPFDKGSDPAKVCDVTVAFLRGVLALPATQAGPVLRNRLHGQFR
jgi:hypothetical protein